VSQIVRYPLLVFALGLVTLWLSLDSAFRRPGTRYDQRKNLEESEANAIPVLCAALWVDDQARKQGSRCRIC
jgi:hypothetical protein